MEEKVLVKGNYAIAQAALNAGLECYFGYPITPQTEIGEYLSGEMYKRKLAYVCAESELAAINMVLGAASTGAKALAKGNADLYAGTTALSAGAKSASEGAATLAAGTVTLHNGATQLDSGATTLATGIGTLQSGSTALIDGVKQLDDGANQLNSGMIQFNEEGIKKLVSAFDGDLSAVLDKANGMIDTSKAYKSFTGISDGMDGEVKFVFVTNK